MVATIPVGAYLIVLDDEGRAAKAVVSGCGDIEGRPVAVLASDGSVRYEEVRACEEVEAVMREVRGEAFEALEPEGGGLLTRDGKAVTPAPTSLGRVRRFEHQHLAHVLGFALGRSGGDGLEDAWGEYPGDAVRHAPKALLRKVGGVGAVLWGVALGGQADVEEFISGLVLGMGRGGARVRLERDALQALTLVLRRGGVRHRIIDGEVVIGSVIDALVPHREAGNVWFEPIEYGGEGSGSGVAITAGFGDPLIVGFVGWYLVKTV